MPREILVPVDGSEHAFEGLRYALEEFPDASITLLSVVGLPEEGSPLEAVAFDELERVLERKRDGAEAVLAESERIADDHGRDVSTALWVGRPATSIVSFAEREAVDQIVMGSRGETTDLDGPIGSVAETVLRRAPVLVTIVR